MTTIQLLLFILLSISFQFGESWVPPSRSLKRKSIPALLFGHEDDIIIDVEILDADNDHSTKSASVMKRNLIMIPRDLFPRISDAHSNNNNANSNNNNNSNNGWNVDELPQGSQNPSNDLVKIMQWEKQVGDTIRKGETILFVEGEESLTGASSSLRVLKDVIAEDDGKLVEIKVASGSVDVNTPIGIMEPIENIIDAELEGAIDAEIESAQVATEQQRPSSSTSQKKEEVQQVPLPQQTVEAQKRAYYNHLQEKSNWYDNPNGRNNAVQSHTLIDPHQIRDPFGSTSTTTTHYQQQQQGPLPDQDRQFQHQRKWYD